MRILIPLLAMVCMAQAVENRGLRVRCKGIETEYDKFLSMTIQGKQLRGLIRPGTFSVFSAGQYRIACAAVNP